MKVSDLSIGQALPSREHTATNVSLFCYNAAVWNPHRIHYDEAYTTEVEKHPGIVIDGPLQGDWLSQVALNWVGDFGMLTEFSYANRQAAYLGEKLTSGGTITAIDTETGIIELELFILNEQNEVITPGNGVVALSS
ncbi:MAG: hypothetical protein GKR90_06495 [Pseudomonadales bacterium]|nr:hypothetical protein [Pseudomonadales bacterium]